MSDSEEGDINQKYISLNSDGIKAYKKIQSDMFKGWCLWALVGVLGGTACSTLVKYVPLKKQSPRILSKYRYWTVALVFSGFGYHGYKVQFKEFHRNRKQLLENKSLCTLISKEEIEEQKDKIEQSKNE